jgi:hypothetical protein
MASFLRVWIDKSYTRFETKGQTGKPVGYASSPAPSSGKYQVVAHPRKSAKLAVGGTRLSVSLVLACLADGMDVEEIRQRLTGHSLSRPYRK